MKAHWHISLLAHLLHLPSCSFRPLSLSGSIFSFAHWHICTYITSSHHAIIQSPNPVVLFHERQHPVIPLAATLFPVKSIGTPVAVIISRGIIAEHFHFHQRNHPLSFITERDAANTLCISPVVLFLQ